jgi:hypothetical protein
VIAVLPAAIAVCGAPQNHGPEFTTYCAIQYWLEKPSIKTIYINLGSPWKNRHIESFHDKLHRCVPQP